MVKCRGGVWEMDDLITVRVHRCFFEQNTRLVFEPSKLLVFEPNNLKQAARFRTEQAASVVTYSTVGSHQHSILDNLHYENN